MRYLIAALLLLSLTACVPSTLPRVTTGMDADSAETACLKAWPPATLVSVKGDQANDLITKTYRQDRGEVQVYIQVEERDGAVTQVHYLAF